MTKLPNDDYSPKDAAYLDDAMARTATADVRNAEATFKVKALCSLVQALDRALKIGIERFIDGKAEPYPGAAGTVMKQARTAIDLARKTGLMP